MVDETEVQRDAVQVLGEPTDGQVPTWDAAKGEWVPQTPTGGGGGGAPTAAEYLVAATHGDLSAERLTTNTATVTWDHGTAGQAKANVPDATTTAKGVVELATSGEASAGVVVQGNDSRLSDARTPTAHASSHAEGGSDRITSLALANTGLTVRDTDDSHELTLKPGSNLTANRSLTISTGDADRTLTLLGDTSIAGTNNGDQAALSVIEVQGDSAIEFSAPDSVVEFVPGSGIAITTNPAADPPKITVQATTNAFGTVAVAGQTSVVADALADTLTLAAGSGISITTTAASDTVTIAATGGVSDGDKGDITVSASGATWTIDPGVVTTTKMGGDVTTAGKALLDDATAADQRATLGLGTVAIESTVPIAKGGTGQTTQTAAMDALSPTASKGDLLVDNGTNVVKLSVGADSKVLFADSSASAGVTYKFPPGHKLYGLYDLAKIVSTDVETTIFDQEIAANTLGATGGIDVLVHGHFFNNSGASRAMTPAVYWGGTKYWADAVTITADASAERPFEIRIRIQNLSATNKQSVRGETKLMTNLTGTTGLGNFGATDNANLVASGTAAGAVSNPAKDTTAAQNVKVTITMATNSASLSTKVDYAEIRYAP